MSAKPMHLVEQAAARLQEMGALELTASNLRDVAKPGALPPLEPISGTSLITRRVKLAVTPDHFLWSREVAPIVARLLASADKRPVVVHVTAVEGGDGTSTVARHIAYTAAKLPWCRTLLLDAHPDHNGRGSTIGGPLPSLLEGFASRASLEVAAIETAGATFHAAAMPPASSPEAMAAMARLRPLLAAEYNLIVTDCTPVLEELHLAPVATHRPRVVLVLQAGRTRVSLALRAKEQIEELGADLFGVVLARQQQLIPRLLDRVL